MKRVDLILSERELDAVLKAIDAAGAPGYSVIKHVTGKGPHGSVSEAMDFSGLGANATRQWKGRSLLQSPSGGFRSCDEPSTNHPQILLKTPNFKFQN